MHTSFNTLLLFISPLIVVALAVELMSRAIPNDYAYKKSIITEKGSSFKTLVLGNSHSYYGINPAYFSELGFNGAHPSQTLEFDAFLLEKFLPSLPNVKTIILPLSYPSLSSILQEDDETWRIKNYLLYYGYTQTKNPRFYFELSTSKPLTTLHEYWNYTQRGVSRIGCSARGFGVGFSTHSSQDITKSGKEAAQRHHAQGDIFHAKNQRALTEILALCRTHNLHLILVTLPASQAYTAAFDTVQRATLHRVRDSLGRSQENVISLSLLDDPRFTQEDFYDGDHLNHQGSKRLSLLLDSLIQSR